MTWISNLYARTGHPRAGAGHASAGGLVCPLVFSLVGLLTDCLALLTQSEASLAPLRFALVACAAPVAAMVALRFAGGAGELLS